MFLRRLTRAALALALLGFGGLAGYWFWAADQVETAIALWAEEQRARGPRRGDGGTSVLNCRAESAKRTRMFADRSKAVIVLVRPVSPRSANLERSSVVSAAWILIIITATL